MVEIVTVVSGNGGMGKSFLSCNLSYGLKKLGKKVLLLEASFGTRADDVILGIKPDTLFTIKDVFENTCKVFEAVTSPMEDNLPDFISASHLRTDNGLDEGFKKIRCYAIDRYDYIIIDTPYSACTLTDAAFKITDTLIAITDTSFLSVRNTGLCVKRAVDSGVPKVFSVINHVCRDSASEDVVIEDIIDETFAPLLGIIPYDEFVHASLMNSNLIYKYDTYAGRALENICKRILGISVPDFETEAKNSFFARNKRFVLK